MTKNNRLAPLGVKTQCLRGVTSIIKHGDSAVNSKLATIRDKTVHDRLKDAVFNIGEAHHAKKGVCIVEGIIETLRQLFVKVLINNLGEYTGLVKVNICLEIASHEKATGRFKRRGLMG